MLFGYTNTGTVGDPHGLVILQWLTDAKRCSNLRRPDIFKSLHAYNPLIYVQDIIFHNYSIWDIVAALTAEVLPNLMPSVRSKKLAS